MEKDGFDFCIGNYYFGVDKWNLYFGSKWIWDRINILDSNQNKKWWNG